MGFGERAHLDQLLLEAFAAHCGHGCVVVVLVVEDSGRCWSCGVERCRGGFEATEDTVLVGTLGGECSKGSLLWRIVGGREE